MSVDHIPVFAHNFTFGVPTAVLAIVSTYVGMAHLENSIAEKPVMWLGSELVNEVKLIAILDSFFGGFQSVCNLIISYQLTSDHIFYKKKSSLNH